MSNNQIHSGNGEGKKTVKNKETEKAAETEPKQPEAAPGCSGWDEQKATERANRRSENPGWRPDLTANTEEEEERLLASPNPLLASSPKLGGGKARRQLWSEEVEEEEKKKTEQNELAGQNGPAGQNEPTGQNENEEQDKPPTPGKGYTDDEVTEAAETDEGGRKRKDRKKKKKRTRRANTSETSVLAESLAGMEVAANETIMEEEEDKE